MDLSPITKLPQETLLRILHYCDLKSIIWFSSTCKKTYTIVKSSASLQLQINLDINGLEVEERSMKGNSSHSLLKELRGYLGAWLNLNFSPVVRQYTSIHRDQVPAFRFDIRDGVLSLDFQAPVLGNENGSDIIAFDSSQALELSSLGTPCQVNFEQKFETSAMDPKQDLMVLVEPLTPTSTFARLHLRSKTTGEPHLLSSEPVITIRLGSASSKVIKRMRPPQVVGEYLMVSFCWTSPAPDGSKLYAYETVLWRWKAGELATRINSEENTLSTFLDKSRIVSYSKLPEQNSVSNGLALFIHDIPDAEDTLNTTQDPKEPSHGVCDILKYPAQKPALTFKLPELLSHAAIDGDGIELFSSPLPGDSVRLNAATLLFSRAMTLELRFTIWNISSDRDLFGRSNAPSSGTLQVFVSTRHLFKHIEANQPGNGAIIEWCQWGPAATRWLKFNEMPNALYGPRYIQAIGSSDGSVSILAMDFNTPAIAVLEHKRTSPGVNHGSLLQSGAHTAVGWDVPVSEQTEDDGVYPGLDGSIVKEETTFSEWFKYPVVSRLPYRTISKTILMGHESFRRIKIDAEYLVMIPDILTLTLSEAENFCLSFGKLDMPSEE
ncbi:unnamed protein product [Rhizoctonia solani]|uniref:F-box domain-containing protein n=1 Tax=Rhizoctonia solani TaxID=456999 RepID=A0A8H3A108_9AGAM|nr:unnamed protein product [Rhizoctonia solani]